MTAVGVLLVVLGLLLSVVLAAALRSAFCVVLFAYHLGASFVYWRYSLTNVADSEGYYSYTSYFTEFDLGTNFVQSLTAFLRDALDASYLDLFMLFHLFGYAGLVLFYQLCRQALESDGEPDGKSALLVYAVCLLPGLHFWTSAIGKDGLVFFAILCVSWSTLDPARRLPALLLGLGICSLIRPHVAALLAASGSLSAALGAGVSVRWRILLFVTLLTGVVLAVPFLQHFVGLESLDSVGVESGIEGRQGNNLEGGSSVDISKYSLPLQVFTYLYRPLVDLRGGLGVIASVENIFLLTISVLYAPSIPRVLRAGPRAFFLRFNLFYWMAATFALASTTANLGIASRQKIMVLPSLIVLLLTGLARKREAAAATETEETDVEAETEAEAEPHEAADAAEAAGGHLER